MRTNWLKDGKNWMIAILSAGCLFLFLKPEAERPASPAPTAQDSIWTCSMHPQIRQSEPGQCPICGMDLIPAATDLDNGGDWSLSLSDNARKLADIQTAPVVRRLVPHQVRMVGKVDYDEKRVSNITAWVPGRIDRLFVDYTGIEVRKNDHMVEIYSPELVSAQQELKQALDTVQRGSASSRVASETRAGAARKKLKLLGLTDDQIRAIEAQEGTMVHLTVQSPMGGVVIKKHLNEGDYVKRGSPIYTIADLRRVWIKLDAYESDLAWLRYGQEVTFEVEAYPGDAFSGRIVFIDPTLNPQTRTVKVRIDMPNPDGKLKPDMFVRAVAHALVNAGGKTIEPSLVGKWMGPMHPEVVKDGPGKCDICGMDLVRAEELGFVTVKPEEEPLIIPASAALITGERAVVYVQNSQEKGRFLGREVVLGPRTGDFYIVKSGLEEGELVVVNGAFKIDSELQIRAKYSMMYHPSEDGPAGMPQRQETSEAFRQSLQPVLAAYFEVQSALSQDDWIQAQKAAGDMEVQMGRVAISALTAASLQAWQEAATDLNAQIKTLRRQSDPALARTPFEAVSSSLFGIIKSFGIPAGSTVFRFHCPMAFEGKGAYWLQNHVGTANPYFGSAMFGCGEQTEQLGISEGEMEGHRHE